jgi:tetratricopeptide (TPR) repeat protein
MRDEAERAPTELLERPRRLPRSWRRRLARLAVIAVGVAVVAQSADYALVHRERDCATAMHDKAWTAAVQICHDEYQRTLDPATGVRLADAQDKTGEHIAAKLTASPLLRTSAIADAFYVLGRIAQHDQRNESAIISLTTARGLHRAKHQWARLAADDGVLAMAYTARSGYAEALRSADECIAQAHLVPDPDLWSYCHLVAAKALIRVGYWSAADVELAIATRFATTDLLRSDLAYQRASLAQESGDYPGAIVFYRDAQRLIQRPTEHGWTLETDLNLAYALAQHKPSNDATQSSELAEARRSAELDEAESYLQAAARLDVDGDRAPERASTAAQIAYARHDLSHATSLNERYLRLRSKDDEPGRADPTDLDDLIDVATLQVRIELERGDLTSAERWARLGVAQAERVRGAQQTAELRPWVLAKRRAPYELLFTALARGGRVEDAALVFDDWQGRTVQDALATPRPPASIDRRDAADHVAKLGNWLSVASQAAFAQPADRAAVLSTMRGIDLLALIVADGEVWRLTADHGAPRLVRLISLTKIGDLLGEFRTQPTDHARAAQLGALLVPDEAFRATDVLHVLVDGRLGAVPVAALRHGDTSLIAVRPIVYTLRLPEVRCVPAARPGHATVLGAAAPDIPSATFEATQIAELLHTTSATGAAATRAALFAAANDAVLHVAAHTALGLDGGALELADGEVSALEISARRVAPTLAVLSGCDTATSDDFELGGALVSGFLAAGAQHVVATLRPISDAGAPDLMTRFYRADGVADPVRALAQVQAALANTAQRDWPYYAVFGSAVCRTGTPDHH